MIGVECDAYETMVDAGSSFSIQIYLVSGPICRRLFHRTHHRRTVVSDVLVDARHGLRY